MNEMIRMHIELENEQLRAALALRDGEIARLRNAIQRVLNEEESTPHGWAPDVTMLYVLKDVMKPPSQPGEG